MPLESIRDLVREKQMQNMIKQRLLQFAPNYLESRNLISDSDLRRTFYQARTEYAQLEHEKTLVYQHNYKQTVEKYKAMDEKKGEPFEFYTTLDLKDLPESRIPEPGINVLPLLYHKTNPVVATEELPESGFRPHKLVKYLLKTKYPLYNEIVKQYCRPLGTTDATFSDFNKEQQYKPLPHPERLDDILELVTHFLDARPYRPMHFCDVRFTKTPANTGTGYYNRHHYSTRAHARYARPEDYKVLPTSKGYYMNTCLVYARTLIHNIKYHGSLSDKSQSAEDTFFYLQKFFEEHATLLFTRNHISKLDGQWKQRPVYCVDDIFLFIEQMLTFPLMVGARRMSSCILYGLETIRGGMAYVDVFAKEYKAYATFDYSGFDQRAPRCLTDIYYKIFLPRLLVINQGYQPTYEYASTPGATRDKLGLAIHNLLSFLHTWYNNMVFITQDGYAYLRTSAGVPSGLLNTQYIDSFINLFMMIDALMSFKYTKEDIRDNFHFLIMGDDNSVFTKRDIGELEAFKEYFCEYVTNNYNAVVNKDKSSVTRLRNKIEILGYQCNFGKPTRKIDKLLAQLCLPEHGTIDKYMSYRALGIVYASAGNDPTFYNFCKDVYYMYYPFKADLNTMTQEVLSKHVLRIFSITDSFMELISADEFPTLEKIQNTFTEWEGPLDYAPRWDFRHFIDTPDTDLENIETLYDYRTEKEIHYENTRDYFPTEP